MNAKNDGIRSAKARLCAEDMEYVFGHEHSFHYWNVRANKDRMLFLYCQKCKTNLVVLVDHDDIAALNNWMDAKTSKFYKDQFDR